MKYACYRVSTQCDVAKVPGRMDSSHECDPNLPHHAMIHGDNGHDSARLAAQPGSLQCRSPNLSPRELTSCRIISAGCTEICKTGKVSILACGCRTPTLWRGGIISCMVMITVPAIGCRHIFPTLGFRPYVIRPSSLPKTDTAAPAFTVCVTIVDFRDYTAEQYIPDYIAVVLDDMIDTELVSIFADDPSTASSIIITRALRLRYRHRGSPRSQHQH